MKVLALAAIWFYQRYLSPLKGFACAFGVHTGRDSCSAYSKRVIARHGLLTGLALLKRRLSACAEVHQRHSPQHHVSARYRAQAGHCDLPCDLPHTHCEVGDACQVLECASCNTSDTSCRDWWRNWRRDRYNEKHRRKRHPRA
jgi:putative component of membrane protein insertase Oxa1/YidC/SpoIIIJ protein YidD